MHLSKRINQTNRDMIPKQKVLKISAFALITTVVCMVSCKEDEPQRLTLQDTADITDEAITESYFQDLDDMAGVAIGSPGDAELSGGRLTYDGKRFMPGSTVVTTTENYSINGVTLEGTRTLTNVQESTTDAPRFNVALANGKATFADGLSATRESNITFQWHRAENPLNDYLQIENSSAAAGVTRLGREYSVDIMEDMIFKRHCGIAVSGVKKYTIDGDKEISIDYGDGTCDRSFVVTINGVSRTVGL